MTGRFSQGVPQLEEGPQSYAIWQGGGKKDTAINVSVGVEDGDGDDAGTAQTHEQDHLELCTAEEGQGVGDRKTSANEWDDLPTRLVGIDHLVPSAEYLDLASETDPWVEQLRQDNSGDVPPQTTRRAKPPMPRNAPQEPIGTARSRAIVMSALAFAQTPRASNRVSVANPEEARPPSRWGHSPPPRHE